MTCLRCDGTGKYRNEFGLMEKCESCQGADMTLKKVTAEPDSDEEGYWEKREEKSSVSTRLKNNLESKHIGKPFNFLRLKSSP